MTGLTKKEIHRLQVVAVNASSGGLWVRYLSRLDRRLVERGLLEESANRLTITTRGQEALRREK